MLLEPAHVPFAQVVGAEDPPAPTAKVEEGEVALQAAVVAEHGGEPHAAGRGQTRGHHPVQPGLGSRAGNLVAGEGGDIEQADARAHALAFARHQLEGVGAAQRRRFLEALGREVERHLETPADPPARTVPGHGVVGWRLAQRPPGGQLFVGIGHDEAARVELPGRLADVLAVGGEIAIAGDVHAEDVALGLAVDHPLGQGLADAAALQEAGHDAAGQPVVGHPAHRPDQGVAIGRKGEGAIDPALDADGLQAGIATEAGGQFLADAVDVLLDQLDAVVIKLIQENIDRIGEELATGFSRYPCLETVGIKRWVNGAFTFSPDGNPLVGPVRRVPNYWLACGVMAGFLQGGGVGKTLAEWMIHGEPEGDVFGMDIARYGDFASNREYIRQTTGQFYSRRFVMTYPNEQLPAGRPLRKAPAYDAMTRDGARWGVSWGLEVPLYFAPEGFEETPTLRRSNAFELVARECKGVRSGVGLLDISAFSRYEVSGPGAETWLNRVMASRLPAPGRVRLAPMLGHDGRLKGDLTLFNLGGGRWWILGSYYLREWHMRWFEQHLQEGVEVRDISDATVGFSISGPNARKLLERVTHADVSNEGFGFMTCRPLDVGLTRVQAARLSVAGELGYELHCPAVEHVTLRETLKAAGEDLGLVEYGFQALNSLRLEKSFGIWSREFTQGYTAGMTGMDRWIDFAKGDFIGREAALKEKESGGPAQRLVTLEIDATNADATGYEPLWKDGQRVGFITSGGYGHCLGKSLAMALVERELAEPGTELTTHIVGEERPACVIPASPYDPEGAKMRA